MMTIMLFTVLFTASDATASAKPVSSTDVWNYLNCKAGCDPCHIGWHGYAPKSASIILRGSGGEYLLFQEKNGKFGYPGGRVDYSDPARPKVKADVTDLSAALREFKEETGFPLLKMIAQSVNVRAARVPGTTLDKMVKRQRVTRSKDGAHQAFFIHIDCPLFDMLTRYKDTGKDGRTGKDVKARMCRDLKPVADEARARQIEAAGWSTYAVGDCAKTDKDGKREGEIVALATFDQVQGAQRKRTIMRGSSFDKKEEKVAEGPYFRMLFTAESLRGR